MTVNLNGDLSQWSMGTTFAAAVSGQPVADGWRLHDTSTAVHTVRRSSDVPSFGLCGRILPYSLEVEVTTGDASVAAGDLTAITYRGEGSELCDLLGGPIRLRLWLKGVAGTYILHISNGAENLSYSQPLVLTHADMWTRFDVWVPEFPDPDSWYTDHRVGYTVALGLCVGSGSQAEMEAWGSGLKFGAGQTNFNATVGNKLKIAGLRIGDGGLFHQAPDVTERDCLRYLQKSFDRDVAPASALGWGTGEATWRAITAGAQGQSTAIRLSPMRKVPNLTFYNPAVAGSQARAKQANADCTGTAVDNKTVAGFRISATCPAGAGFNEELGAHWVADASLPALTTSIGG